ncbi:MOB kinase activator-like 4 [Trametes pubescens]|uniref:MOB kinase activator-like 4 n=1 Tax=Trametes pubescens TaxID=154538 RepID=A0A1M2V296_TRAPU|nr:MOB kinase activator-like 4 [Trametes pubescens]
MTVPIQRPLKGSRISSFYPVKTLPPISALDSAFQLQEYISLLIRLDVHDVEKIVAIPGKDQNDTSENGAGKADEKDADKDAAGGVNVDPACWVYEHLRRVAQDLSHPLITMLQQECTRSSCPEMKAGEWLYLCVAHGNDGAMEQCCAIDYILHTLDSATALLNSPRAFPSRLSVPSTSHRHFTSLCRRLGRIFAHAYFHHREVFEQAEAESSLYARFLALVKYFDLVPLEFLVIPPRMEGRAEPVEPPRLMGAALEPRRDSVTVLRPKSPPGPAGVARDGSPRKFGRARTDTMVYSEAFSVAEELAKGDLSEVDIDREIAVERAASVPGVSEPFVPPLGPVVPPPALEAESVIEPLPAVTADDVAEEPEIIIPPRLEEPEPEEEQATQSVEEGSTLAAAPAVEAPSEGPANAPEEAPEAPEVPFKEETASAPATEPTAPPAQEADVPVEAELATPIEPEVEAPAAVEDAKEDVEPEATEAAPETDEAAATAEETETPEEVVPETVPEPAPAAEEVATEPNVGEAEDPVETAEPKEQPEEIAETPSYAAVAAPTADESESPQADTSIEEESEVEQLTDAAKEPEVPVAES